MWLKRKRPRRRIRLSWLLIGCAAVVMVLPDIAGIASAQSQFAYNTTYDFATSGAASRYISNNQCLSPTCSLLSGLLSPNPNPAPVNSSDWAVGQAITMENLSDGEVVTWNFTTPRGSTVFLFSLTYNAGSDCFIGSDGAQYCGYNDAIAFMASGSVNSCLQRWSPQETGTWSINTYDNNNHLYSQPFTISHNASSIVGITSPTDNQLFQLTSGNYNATGPVQFSAGSGIGNSLNWTAQLHYLSSGGYGGPDPAALTFPGYTYSYSGYQSIGGQVLATASTTASDGSSVQDCVTFYVEGPESGIPDNTITSQLDSLYTGSQSYPTDPTGQYPPTPNLMTGVAERESTYHQFLYSDELAPGQNPDLFSLYKNFTIDAFFPTENLQNNYAGPGQQIGLMQEPTTDPDAWDWTKNTTDGVNLFSGTVSPNKITLARNYATAIINGDPKNAIDGYDKLNPPVGNQLENMALVLYGGDLVATCGITPSETCSLTHQYYIPFCSGTQGTTRQKGQTYLTCSTGWQWSVNSTNQPKGVAYVNYIMTNLKTIQ